MSQNQQKIPSAEDPHSSKNEVCIKELHELYIKFKFHGACNSEVTIKNLRKNFELLLQFKPDITLNDLSEETILNFFEYLNTRKRKVGKEDVVRVYKNSSLATVRSKLNGFFNWLLERNYLAKNPFEKIPYPQVAYTDSRAFTSDEIDKICNAVNTKIQWANLIVKKRNIAIVMFLLFTGVRKEELMGLTLSDIDMNRKLINIRSETTKSKRARMIPINPQLIFYIEDYLNARSKYLTHSFWVSGTLDRGFTEHGAKHFIDLLNKFTKVNCHLHRFRHTFATNYYKQTHDLVGLQRLMGHRSLKMTLSYLRSLPDDHVVEQIRKISLDEFI